MYFHKPTKLCVISAVEVASHAPGLEPICTYHVSMSKNGKYRATPEETRFVLKAFGMEDASEDNHVPGGIARNFWRPEPCLLYTSPSPRDRQKSRMPSSA